MKSKLLLFLLIKCLINLSGIADNINDAEWHRLKEKALDRKRRIIYNTDGCDAVYFPRKLKASKGNFIKQRLIHAIGTQIDTVSYCPLSSGFGYITSRTSVGDQLLVNPPHAPSKRNITAELLKQGTDPLKITEEFCRKNNFEFFVSLRCNDTHDMSHHKGKPFFLFPPYKEKHPEFLLGSYYKRPPHCSWSAVDFTHKQVRKRFLSIIRELITNYEVDGLELDFCRHLQYFKSVAWGKQADKQELKMMTDCMREIRKMTEKLGRKRKRPILIAVRLPDSAAYSKAVGLDVEEWMREKLIDIYIGSFYFRLNPWQRSIDLCKKYGVKFYASFDESRMRGQGAGFGRSNFITDRARQAAAFQAGVDGIYYFNREGASALKKTMRGSLNSIRLDNKRYFISYRHRSPYVYLKGGERYSNLPGLSRYSPALIFPGNPKKFILEIGDDFNHPALKRSQPIVKAYADINAKDSKRLVIKLNGYKLLKPDIKPNITIFSVPLNYLKPGINEVAIEALPSTNSGTKKNIIMSGKKLLKGKYQVPWRRLFPVHDFANSEKIVNGAYRISDTGKNSMGFANLLYPLKHISSDGDLHLEFQARVEHSSTPLAVCCRIANGCNIEIITLQPDRIGLLFSGKSVKFNTTDRFHNYCAIIRKGNFILTVDNKEIFNEKMQIRADDIDGHLKGNMYSMPNMHQQSLLFGSISGKGTGSALWKNVYIIDKNDGIQLKDLKFELTIDKNHYLKKYKSFDPKWDIVLDAKFNPLNNLKLFRNRYRKKNLTVTSSNDGNKVLLLKTTSSNETIEVLKKSLVNVRSGIFLAECKVKPLSNKPEKGTFMLCIRTRETKGDIMLFYIKLFHDAIQVPWGNIKLKDNMSKRWMVFRMAIDINKKNAMLWMNGKKIGFGRIPSRAGVRPGIFIGGGSKSINGELELEYVKFTVEAKQKGIK